MKNKKIAIFLALFFFVLSTCPNLLHASDTLLEKGIEQYKSENYEEAVDILANARKEQPDSSVAAFYLGITYKQLREYRLAEKNLRDAIQLTPPVKDAYLELAEVLFVLEQLNEAEGWALKSEQEGIKTANAVFMRGLILAKRDRTDEAVDAFNKAKVLDKALSQSADFQIAMAQIKKQSFEDARKSFSAIQEIDPTSELASFAKEYERSLTRTLDMYKPWRFSFGVAYQYDDNVILKPTTDIPGVEITGERDSSIIATLGVIYSPRLKGPFFLNCQYNLYTDTYFAVNTHNLVTHTISVNPGVNFQKGFVSAPLSYSHIWVHGGEYMGVLSMKPALQFAFNPSNIGRISLGYEKRELLKAPIDSDEDRDGNVFSASAGYIHPFAQGRGLFNALYEFTYDNTDGKNWDNTGNRFSLGLLLPSLIWKTNLILSGDVFLQDYKNTHTVFEKQRRDNTYTVSANLVREIVRGLYMNLQYSYTRADSNITVYDYDRNIYTAGIEYRF
jgi:tetratricopeptide (TPR) repeat protein